MADVCPNCDYPEMECKVFSYYGVKDGVYLDKKKLITIRECVCPRCGNHPRAVTESKM